MHETLISAPEYRLRSRTGQFQSKGFFAPSGRTKMNDPRAFLAVPSAVFDFQNGSPWFQSIHADNT
jgi:hypothetical protein